MADLSCPTCLDPECIVPVSRQTTEIFKTGTWSEVRPRFVEKISPCRAACPVGNNIVKAASAAADGDFDASLAAFLEESPLPGVCGRVCHHPCQLSCNRIDVDGSVGVRAIERASADFGNARPVLLTDAGRSIPVAIVGAGPAGLACAYHLARLGHSVSLLEAAGIPGGLTSRGIPAFRLPPEVFEKDLERILSLSITLKTGVSIGAKEMDKLTGEYAAVFLSPGADAHLALGISGEKLEGVLEGLAFLRNEELRAKAKGADVVVIGGGNTALDSARIAMRAGANSVRVLYRRSRKQMPAFEDELTEAGAEGVQIEELVAPVSFIEKDGRLAAVRLLKMRLEDVDADGRPKPVPVEGSETELACDLAIVAAGQGPRRECLPETLRMEHGRVWVDGWGRTSEEKLFAGGDLTPANASVVDAMATGKKAALGIHLSTVGGLKDDVLQRVLLGTGPAFSLTACFDRPEGWQPQKVACPDPITLCFAPIQPPLEEKEADPKERVNTGEEVALGLTKTEAEKEAERCLCCGTCVGCDRCHTFCPEGAVCPPEKEGDAYAAQDDFCKGCGICASVCLRGVMEPGGDR